MARSKRYIYGLMRAADDKDFGCIGLEHEGKPARVYSVCVGSVAAVVSEYGGAERVLPLRKNLEPHQRVIREAMTAGTIVPMAFGHLARSEGALAKTLRQHGEAIRAQLDRVDGKVEMGLKVKWDVDNVFEYFVARDDGLRALRDEMFGRSRAPTATEKIELGRMFEQRVESEREQQTERVAIAFREYFSDMTENSPKGEKGIMDLAFLVPRPGVKAFEERVYTVAGTFSAEYVFDMSGPWAPFNFVELDLHASSG